MTFPDHFGSSRIVIQRSTMEQGEEEVYDDAADGVEHGEGAEEDAGFDEDELDSALADAQGIIVLLCFVNID